MPHIHTEPGQFDHSVEVFIVCDGKVLVRKHDKYGIWIGVGGHVELDEDINQTALREVKEEVGLDITLLSPRAMAPASDNDTELIPPFFLNRHRISDTHLHLAYIFFATSESQDVLPEKTTDQWQWLSKEDVERNELGLEPNIQFYVLHALEAAGSH